MEDGEDDIFNPFFSDADALPSSAAPKKPFSRPGSRFQPKGLKAPKPEPSSDSLPALPEEPRDAKPPSPPAGNSKTASIDASVAMAAGDEAEPMDVDADNGEDEVVREIDVFFNPSIGDGTRLFLVQYLLRPSWRPYGLDRRCKEARMKPQQTELEFGLAVDTYNENYDNDADEHLKTPLQRLSGSKMPLVTSYAVGILKGNELHLNPVNAAVQLHPLFKRAEESNVKNIVETADDKIEPPAINKGKQKLDQVPENESPSGSEDWISLDFHPFQSQLSSSYRQKLLAEVNKDIQFPVVPHDYLHKLCPGASWSKQTKDLSKRSLLTMPMDERLKLLFTQGGHVHRFAALLHFAGNESAEDFLKLLPNYAQLVQGLWVSNSSLFFEGREAAFREYVLFLFSKSTTIPANKIPSDLEGVIMPSLASKRACFNDWKFSEVPDTTFIKHHPNIVAEQEYIWSSREKGIMNALAEVGRSGHTNRRDRIDHFRANAVASSRDVDPGSVAGKVLNEKTNAAISDQARAALLKVIPKVLEKHKVCGISTICHHLRDMALSDSQLQKRDPSASIAAAVSFIDRPDVLKEIISHIALPIHDVYVLKSTGNPSIDPFRNVVIDLLRVRVRDSKLKKEQIFAAAKSKLNRDVSDADYKTVLSELCDHKGGGWTLKSGDGKPG